MGKPAGKTLGGRGSDYDRRFEDSGAIDGSFCGKCGRPCIPHPSGKCRSCRPKLVAREIRKFTPEDEARIEQELDELVTAEQARQGSTDPADREAAEAALAEARAKVDEARSAAGRMPTSKNGSARRRLNETERAIRAAQAKARAAELAARPEEVEAVCLLKSCSKKFIKKRILQECCSKECALAIEKMRFKVSSKKVEEDAGTRVGVGSDPVVRRVPEVRDVAPAPAEAPDHEDAAPAGRMAVVEGRAEDVADRVLEGVREEDREDRPESSAEGEEESVKTKRSPVPSKVTEDQIKWADEQNRPPYNRGHIELSREIGVAQSTLSRLLRDYREKNGLDTPDVVANRRAARGDAPQKKIPKKMPKEKKMPATVELRNDQILSRTEALKLAARLHKQKRAAAAIVAVLVGKGFDQKQAEALAYEPKTALKKNAKKERTVDATTTDIAKRPERSGKIIGIPLEGIVMDAEKAKTELDGHKGACPDCQGKVSAKELCMLGRAFASRWARLEFIAASA